MGHTSHAKKCRKIREADLKNSLAYHVHLHLPVHFGKLHCRQNESCDIPSLIMYWFDMMTCRLQQSIALIMNPVEITLIYMLRIRLYHNVNNMFMVRRTLYLVPSPVLNQCTIGKLWSNVELYHHPKTLRHWPWFATHLTCTKEDTFCFQLPDLTC